MIDLPRLAEFAVAYSRGDVPANYFVGAFVDKLTLETVRPALGALAADQAKVICEWIDYAELWDRDAERLHPLSGGRAVEEELLKWRLDIAAATAADRVRADPAAPDFPALLDVLEGRTALPRPAADPAAARQPDPVAAAA